VPRRINGYSLNDISTSPELIVPSGGGVYIIVQDKTRRGTEPPGKEFEQRHDAMPPIPIYVGQSSNFRQRWKERLQEPYRLGITDSVGWLPHPIHVWFGPITIETPPGYKGDKKKEAGYQTTVRMTVEHAIIRTLLESNVVERLEPEEYKKKRKKPPLKGTQGLLRNQSSFAEFLAIGALPFPSNVSIHIKNLLPPVPWWKSQALKKLAKKGYSHVTATNIKTGVTGQRSDLIIRTGEKYELFFG